MGSRQVGENVQRDSARTQRVIGFRRVPQADEHASLGAEGNETLYGADIVEYTEESQLRIGSGYAMEYGDGICMCSRYGADMWGYGVDMG